MGREQGQVVIVRGQEVLVRVSLVGCVVTIRKFENISTWKWAYRATWAQDNFEVAGFFGAGLGCPGTGVRGLACTAEEGAPLGFGSTSHTEVDSPQPVPVLWDDKSCA